MIKTKVSAVAARKLSESASEFFFYIRFCSITRESSASALFIVTDVENKKFPL